MSPEQARGDAVDKRTDIWAFGCVAFEMCAGRPPFGSLSMLDTVSSPPETEPEWAALPELTPAVLVGLVRRCLTRDPRARLRDIGEARIALSSPLAEPVRNRPGVPWRWLAVAAGGAMVVAALAAILALRIGGTTSPSARPAVGFHVFPPDGGRFDVHPARTFLALSPDGSQLAFIAFTDRPRVWAAADWQTPRARPIAGTDGATSVFWSPDGRSLAFFAQGKLKRVELPAGAAVTIADVPASGVMHGTWGSGGDILLGLSNGAAIYSVPAAGGVPREILTPDRAERRDACALAVVPARRPPLPLHRASPGWRRRDTAGTAGRRRPHP